MQNLAADQRLNRRGKYGWPRYGSAAGAVIVITTSISALNLNSRKKIPTSTVRTPHRTPAGPQ
jgi:hypothetical protein